MALSHLEEIVKSTAAKNNIDLVRSIDRVVWEANEKLNRGEIDLAAAMEMIRKAFGPKFDKFDYKDIEKEASYNLRK